MNDSNIYTMIAAPYCQEYYELHNKKVPDADGVKQQILKWVKDDMNTTLKYNGYDPKDFLRFCACVVAHQDEINWHLIQDYLVSKQMPETFEEYTELAKHFVKDYYGKYAKDMPDPDRVKQEIIEFVNRDALHMMDGLVDYDAADWYKFCAIVLTQPETIDWVVVQSWVVEEYQEENSDVESYVCYDCCRYTNQSKIEREKYDPVCKSCYEKDQNYEKAPISNLIAV